MITANRDYELRVWRDDLPSNPADVGDWRERATSAEIAEDGLPTTPAAR